MVSSKEAITTNLFEDIFGVFPDFPKSPFVGFPDALGQTHLANGCTQQMERKLRGSQTQPQSSSGLMKRYCVPGEGAGEGAFSLTRGDAH